MYIQYALHMHIHTQVRVYLSYVSYLRVSYVHAQTSTYVQHTNKVQSPTQNSAFVNILSNLDNKQQRQIC